MSRIVTKRVPLWGNREIHGGRIAKSNRFVQTRKCLIEFCRREISSFKVPRHIRFVTEWPMSSSKIQKFRLRTALVEELGLA